jgi:hypothetical protein
MLRSGFFSCRKPLTERSRWLSGAEAIKIASTPLSELLNLMAVTLALLTKTLQRKSCTIQKNPL